MIYFVEINITNPELLDFGEGYKTIFNIYTLIGEAAVKLSENSPEDRYIPFVKFPVGGTAWKTYQE